MNVSVRLAVFALVLALVFAAGIGLGAAVGPFDEEPAPAPHVEHTP